MKKWQLDLQLFAGSLTAAITKGANITTGTVSPSSSIAEEDTVTLTIVPASGYHFILRCLSGNVSEVTKGANNTYTFKAPAASTVFSVEAEKDDLYRVLEECYANVNGNEIELHRNVELRMVDGDIAEAITKPTEITGATEGALAIAAAQINALLAAGLIEKVVTDGGVKIKAGS